MCRNLAMGHRARRLAVAPPIGGSTSTAPCQRVRGSTMPGDERRADAPHRHHLRRHGPDLRGAAVRARRAAQRLVEVADLPPGGRVLDVATGTGHAAIAAAARLGPTGSVLGIDISEGMLEIARGTIEPLGLPIEGPRRRRAGPRPARRVVRRRHLRLGHLLRAGPGGGCPGVPPRARPRRPARVHGLRREHAAGAPRALHGRARPPRPPADAGAGDAAAAARGVPAAAGGRGVRRRRGLDRAARLPPPRRGGALARDRGLAGGPALAGVPADVVARVREEHLAELAELGRPGTASGSTSRRTSRPGARA